MENFRIVLDCRQEKNMNNFHDSFTFYSMHLLTGWDCLWAGVVEKRWLPLGRCCGKLWLPLGRCYVQCVSL